MPETNTIEHSGIVQTIGDKYINVLIVSHPACAGCAASNICDVSGKNEKIIKAKRIDGVLVGEEVSVVMSQEQGFRALFIGYILPFIIVLVLLIFLTSLKLHEALAGLIALGSLIPYYLYIYLSREEIGKKFSFSIKKQIR
ncbi:MAG: SoxR reducing system RseC family protein [Marinilabiliaceae bacterium]|jgi:sigma-E factor negative regulatory protein RseC|nr:SoxR reducing system RseC family protein [Marinilabiliaceae bacterium]